MKHWGTHFNNIKLLITNSWSIYSVLLIPSDQYELLVLSPQPLGVVSYEGKDLITKREVNQTLKSILNSTFAQMIKLG